jgi:2'-hydroxyisoflavone reductase
MPIWAPPVGDYAGVHAVSNRAAVARGLGFRPIATTVQDTLAWWDTQPEERQARLQTGPAPEEEARLLKALGLI